MHPRDQNLVRIGRPRSKTDFLIFSAESSALKNGFGEVKTFESKIQIISQLINQIEDSHAKDSSLHKMSLYEPQSDKQPPFNPSVDGSSHKIETLTASLKILSKEAKSRQAQDE